MNVLSKIVVSACFLLCSSFAVAQAAQTSVMTYNTYSQAKSALKKGFLKKGQLVDVVERKRRYLVINNPNGTVLILETTLSGGAKNGSAR